MQPFLTFSEFTNDYELYSFKKKYQQGGGGYPYSALLQCQSSCNYIQSID